MWRVYLDTCCLNRLFDDRSQERVRLEAEAVVLILSRFVTRDWHWISSEAVSTEIEQTRDLDRRARTRMVADDAHQVVAVEQSQLERARQLQALGFHPFDALHLACAEAGGAEVFLTTDDGLLRRALRVADQIRLKVANPLRWLEEVTSP